MTNTYFTVYAVTYNDPVLSREWEDAGATVIEAPESTFAKKCNYAFTQTRGEWSLYVGEDVEFTQSWYEAFPKYSKYGVVGTNALLFSNETRSPHLIINRDYTLEIGGSWDTKLPFHTYIHNYADTETIAKAMHYNQWIYASDIIIKHLHPAAGLGTKDEVYLMGDKSFYKDQHTYNSRLEKYSHAVSAGTHWGL